MSDLNPRLNAFRPDLADMRLKGRVDAPASSNPSRSKSLSPSQTCAAPRAPTAASIHNCSTAKRWTCSKPVEGWCWVQAHSDGYVGYVADTALTSRTHEATHIICAPRTFLYPGPDMKLPAETALSMGSRVSVIGEAETRGTNYLQLANGGAIIANHAMPISQPFSDPVAVAQSLLHTPYLWGGRSGHGIDCSGLVQLSHALCGISLQRDTSMQKDSAGTLIDPAHNPTAPRRPHLLASPRRHDARRKIHHPRQRPFHGRRHRRLSGSARPHRIHVRHPDCVSAGGRVARATLFF